MALCDDVALKMIIDKQGVEKHAYQYLPDVLMLGDWALDAAMTHTKKKCRIVLIHATAVSIGPILAAFTNEWPAAETVNVLDDSLSRDRDSGKAEPDVIEQRIAALANYGLQVGADGILFSCSAFGREIEAVKARLRIPVLKPNEAMFEEALAIGGRIGMIATFRPSIPSMEQEFQALAEGLGKTARLDSLFVAEAMAALARGDLETHNRLIREASSAFAGYDTVMLAQFSASQALPAVADELGCTVLTSPLSVVKKMKKYLSG